MNDDKKFGNMSEGEFRDLQEAPLQQPASEGADIPIGLNDDALNMAVDKDILAADLDDVDDLMPVDLVFMLLSPPEAGAEHLKSLARVSRRLRDRGFAEKLRGAASRDALYALLTVVEARDAA